MDLGPAPPQKPHAGISPEATLSNDDSKQEKLFFHPNLVKKPLQPSSMVPAHPGNSNMETTNSGGNNLHTLTG